MFDIVVAMNTDSLIGVKEYGVYSLPWPTLREDMRHFRRLTSLSACIVGYNTSLTLPSSFETETRKLVIMDRDMTFDQALDRAKSLSSSVMVIGGAEVYRQALMHKDLQYIYCTLVQSTYPEVEVEQLIYFPVRYQHLPGIWLSCREYHDVQTNTRMRFEKISCLTRFLFQPQRLVRTVQVKPRSDPYYDLVQRIVNEGIDKEGRNGGTRSVFGHQLTYDLADGYPINTLKRCYPKAIFEELMWMIRGQTNVKILQDKGVRVWDSNSSAEFLKQRGLTLQEGDIGPGYGFQMRHAGETYVDCFTSYRGVDQLQNVINLIRTDPNNRRMIINLWDPTMIDQMALPPCHMVYQFGVNEGRLDCHLFQRSWDVMLGWNTATAALLTYLLAHHCDLNPGKVVHSISDCHIYHDHLPAARTLLSRQPRPYPKLWIRGKQDCIEDYEFTDLTIEGYLPCPAIKMNMIA